MKSQLQNLDEQIKGELYCNSLYKHMYATDASAYREIPLGVVYPKDTQDLKTILNFCSQNKIPLIPRAAGTSLAGQVVGNGLIVDISKYMTKIVEINSTKNWAIVEPGVIRDELNRVVAKEQLFFAPETSTSNRAMIGGMVGNNSCGANSLIYGSTREHIISLKALLYDGSEVQFSEIDKATFLQKCSLETSEGEIYRHINKTLSNNAFRAEIENQYPDPEIKRRNTGYALDLLMDSSVFDANSSKTFNFCKLIAGSEGTLCLITEIKVKLTPLPPKHKTLLCVHLNTIKEALYGNIIALRHKPYAIELMDHEILQLTKDNIEQRKNRFFVEGDPGAILIIEIVENSDEAVKQKAKDIINELKTDNLGYHFPLVSGEEMKKVWDLRKAGLGILSNMPGDAKPVPVVEDTAVNPAILPQFIEEFNQMLKHKHLNCIYYAHIGTGELHLRPVLNLKTSKDIELFREVALETAKIVKKFKGSLSGEHGDGRLRGEFIPLMMGEEIYQSFKELKKVWDPQSIINPNKIVDTPPMNSSLRYTADQATPEIETIFDFSSTAGIIRAIEKCNGSGDCRKTKLAGGTMCPSYQATLDEKHSTRARANILREFLTNSKKKNKFNHKEIKEALDLCLSCKACKAECPSNIDITKFKAEFLQQYYKSNGVPFRSWMIGYFPYFNAIGAKMPHVFNFFATQPVFSYVLKIGLGFAPQRSIPTVCKITLRNWAKVNLKNPENPIQKIYFFIDEFTDINDTKIGIKALKLLNALNYHVEIVNHAYSGRTFLSKGMLLKAKKLATKNVTIFTPLISDETPLIGIEPSGILSFRDEYPELVDDNLKTDALKLSRNCFLIDEFISSEFQKGNISADRFSEENAAILFHGHCYQKALASTTSSKIMMSIPKNYKVEEIASGCCGMAGAFGFEKEHYKTSMAVGNLVLLPKINEASKDTLITATGTSCRHQIKDGSKRTAMHPVEVLYEALLK